MRSARLEASLVVVPTTESHSTDDIIRCALGLHIVPRIDKAGMVPGLRRARSTCEVKEIIVRNRSGATLDSRTDVAFPVTVSDDEPVPILVTVHDVDRTLELSFFAFASDTTIYSAWRRRPEPVAREMLLVAVELTG